MNNSPTKELYSLRRSFSVIGLTGRMGSGSSTVADYLSQSHEKFFDDSELRKPIEIVVEKDQFNTNLFRRKYNICYNFYAKNHIQYDVIDYKKALLLYVIDYYKNESNPQELISNLILKWFDKSKKHDVDFPEINFTPTELKDLAVDNTLLSTVISKLKSIDGNVTEIKTRESFEVLKDLFFDRTGEFNQWTDLLFSEFKEKNYYLRTFFFHKIANNIRATGNPDERFNETEVPTTKYIYVVAKTINRLIKAYKADDKNKENCHLVINSLKNSLEIMFFKERYSAFYLLTTNNQDNYSDEIVKRIPQNDDFEITSKKLLELDNIECSSSDFSKGNFFSPDVENSIQKAEIHIQNNLTKENIYDFHTVKEQLIKVLSLIQQPGIITPSNQERCMLTAYNSKFNSGCISRQVGAVLTDDSFSIKSVGWNDVPKQSITCLLKNSEELIEDTINVNDMTYSEFEVKSSTYEYKPNSYPTEAESILLNKNHVGKNFHENLTESVDNIEMLKQEGKNCTFCFKSMHNKFEGEKNQVHTRSLHAEENAMLQITKYGGQAILNGKLFTTASPCELCAKKACQIGVKEIYYIDPYPGISMDHVLKHGNSQPTLIPFKGIIGKSFNKLYEPLMSYKDELSLYKNK